MTSLYVISDSFGSYNGTATIPDIAAASLGWTLTKDAIGGSSYAAGTAETAFGVRTTAAIAAAPDVALVLGSVNDRVDWRSPVTLAAAVQAALAPLVAAIPRVYAVFLTGSDGIGITSAAWGETAMAATRDVMRDAAGAVGAVFIDGVGWITGTGCVGSETGDGNADAYTVPQMVHPSNAGARYLGTRLAHAIRPPATGLVGSF